MNQRDSAGTSPDTRSASRRQFLRLGVAAAGGLAALSLVGCRQSSAPPSSSASPSQSPTHPPVAQTLTRLKLGVATAVFENGYTQVGIGKGFYREQGLDIEYTELADGGTITKAMLAGELDAAETAPSTLFVAAAGGAPLRLVGMVRPKLNFVLFTRKDINKPEDLMGKSVGTAAPGSFLHQLMQAWLKAVKVDDSKVNFVNIGASSAVFQAVMTGKVDAGPSTVEFLPQLQAAKTDVKTLVNFWEVLPDYIRVGIQTTEKLLKDRPEVLTKLMVAMATSLRYGIEHGDDVVRFAVEKYSKKPEDVKFGHEFEVKNRILSPDLDFTEQQVEFMQRLNIDSGSQRELLPFERVATLDFQRLVIEQIGKYTWKS